jgi:hypothetical protein
MSLIEMTTLDSLEPRSWSLALLLLLLLLTLFIIIIIIVIIIGGEGECI